MGSRISGDPRQPAMWIAGSGDRVTKYRHKIAEPYNCVINDNKIDSQWTSKSDCDAGFSTLVDATDLYCDRYVHSIAMYYTPKSFANTDLYTTTSRPKGSHVRDEVIPSCPPCQVESSLSLGSCHEDCNITAGIARCVNNKVVKNVGKERFNFSIQSVGFCNLDCPSGTTDQGTYCRLNPVARGAGTGLKCSGRWQQYGAGCYTPCNETGGISTWNGTAQVKKVGYEYFNFDMQTVGLCSQECPPGTDDGGLFCHRQNYPRTPEEKP